MPVNLQWPEPIAIDGDFTVARACSLPVLRAPIKATTVEYVLTQDWMQLRRYHAALALNTAHPSAGKVPDYSAWKLVEEGPKADMGGGVVKWQRTYAKVPDSHDEYENYSYSFIGFQGLIQSGGTSVNVTVTGRARTAHIVISRVQHDYFLTGPGGTYTTPASIPVLKGLRYYANPTSAFDAGLETDFIRDAITIFPATLPDRTTYDTWTANARTYGFGGGQILEGESANWGSITNPSQFVAEDSRLSRWMGNIWLRQSRFVLAQ